MKCQRARRDKIKASLVPFITPFSNSQLVMSIRQVMSVIRIYSLKRNKHKAYGLSPSSMKKEMN
jgi:hypothetical protein